MDRFTKDAYDNEVVENAVFEGCLKATEFYDCVFRNVSFQACRLQECGFDNCEFIQCNLSLMEIVHTSFLDVRFADCKMIGVSWSAVGGFLSAGYEGCMLDNNLFSDMSLKQFSFTSCSLVEASFFNTNLQHSVFDDCDLQGCQFSQTDLSFADFTTSRNYFMNATSNTLHNTCFSLPEAAALLGNLDIVLK